MEYSTVLVTGATGMVGGGVVRALRAGGHDVVAVVRSAERGAALAREGVKLAIGDMLKPETYVGLVADVHAVVHTAQLSLEGRLSAAKAARIQAADHVMTGALARACLSGGKRFVYTSGVFTHGDHGAGWITEETPFAPSPLGVGHAREMTWLRALRAERGLDAVVVSPGFVIGPGGLFQRSFYDQVKQGRLRVIGGGDNYWSCVHVDDLASGYVAALTRAPAGGEYHLVDDEPLTLRDLVDTVTNTMGTPRVGNIPAWIMGLIIGAPLVRSLVTSFRVRNTRARTDLAWTPRFGSVRDAMPSVVAALEGAR